MSFTSFLFDSPFLTKVRLYILGCISTSITTLAILIVIWWLSDSFVTFSNMLQSQIGRIIAISTAIGSILCFFLVLDVDMIKYYFFPPSLTPKSRDRRNFNMDAGNKFIFGYGMPLGIFILVVIVFLWGYFVEGERWDSLLRTILLFILPFPIAFLITYFGGMIIEIIFLTLGYIIQRNRH